MEKVDLIRQFLEERYKRSGGKGASPAEDLEKLKDLWAPSVASLRVLASKEYGLGLVSRKVFEDLGMVDALQSVEDKHKAQYPFAEIIWSMVLNRLIDPMSKNAANDWAQNDANLPDVADLNVEHYYRALDHLEKHSEAVLAVVGQSARATLSTAELEPLLIDTTTSYLVTEYDDVERQQLVEDWENFEKGQGKKPSIAKPKVTNDPVLLMRGHSKDHRPNLPQIKIGLALTKQGKIVNIQLRNGATGDQKMTLDLLKEARQQLPDHNLVAVMDSGMGGTPNLKEIDKLQPSFHRVSAVPLRRSKTAEEHLLQKTGRWKRHPYKRGFLYRSQILAPSENSSGRKEIWIATRNSKEEGRQLRAIERNVEKVKTALKKNNKPSKKGKPVCKELLQANLRRFVKLNAKGTRIILDQDAIRLERRRAGVHLLRSTLVNHPAEMSLRAYDAQYGIEATFRLFKSGVKLRPMYHRKASRIRAHLIINALSVMLIRELERRSGHTLQQLKKVIGRNRITLMQQGSRKFWQRQVWSPEALAVLEKLEVSPGAEKWAHIEK